MNIQELKKKYDDQDIVCLEEKVRNGIRGHREMIEILVYLQEEGRWKENKRYAKEPFAVYLLNEFGIKDNQYWDWKLVLTRYEKPAFEDGLGTGTVKKIHQQCGPVYGKRAIDEITKLQAAKPITQEKINAIIEKHRDPERHQEKKPPMDWKAISEAKDKIIETLRKQHAQDQETIKELREQNEKLKRTVRSSRSNVTPN